MSRPENISPARLSDGSGATRGNSKQPKIGGLKKPDQRKANGTVDEAAKESFPASDPPAYAGGVEKEPVAQPPRENDSEEAS